MGSICATQPAQLIHRLPQMPSISSNLKVNTCLSSSSRYSVWSSRFKNVVKLQTRERLIVACASSSNSNPSGGESGDAARGPPFLTIVAGFLAFLCIIWVFGSIIMWFLGPILKLASSK